MPLPPAGLADLQSFITNAMGFVGPLGMAAETGAGRILFGRAEEYGPNWTYYPILKHTGEPIGETILKYHPERKMLTVDWLAGLGSPRGVRPLGHGTIKEVLRQAILRHPEAEFLRFERASGAAAEHLGYPDRIVPISLIRRHLFRGATL